MIERIADWFAGKQIAAGIIQEEEKSIYTYGYILTMETVLNICISFVIALLLQMIECFIVFSCMFIPLRIFCGGWHASKSWLCTLISNVTLTLVMVIVKYQLVPFNMQIMGVVEAICLLIVFLLSPVEHENKPLYNSERSAYGEISKILYILQLVLLVLFYYANGMEIIESGMYAHVALVISMLLALCQKHRNKDKNME